MKPRVLLSPTKLRCALKRSQVEECWLVAVEPAAEKPDVSVDSARALAEGCDPRADFDMLKEASFHNPLIQLTSLKAYTLYTDASELAVGAVLMLDHGDDP